MTEAAPSCPTCKKTLTSAEFRPFCSLRCRAADLGSWFSESYRISRPILETDLDAAPPLPPSEETGD